MPRDARRLSLRHNSGEMSDRADVDVWLVNLEAAGDWLPPTLAEAERAARLVSAALQRRYLHSHAALRAILGRYATAALDFAVGEHGKPYLPALPELRFNLSHSHEMALIAVSREVEVGVDVERLRPLPECMAIAERFFPPVDAAALAEVAPDAREAEFFRRWTRIEAMLKACGVGLYGAGRTLDGDWAVLPVEVGPHYYAAVAASRKEMAIRVFPFSAGL